MRLKLLVWDFSSKVAYVFYLDPENLGWILPNFVGEKVTLGDACTNFGFTKTKGYKYALHDMVRQFLHEKWSWLWRYNWLRLINNRLLEVLWLGFCDSLSRPETFYCQVLNLPLICFVVVLLCLSYSTWTFEIKCST